MVIIYVLAAMFINTLPAQIFPSDTLFANDSISTFYDTYPTEEDSISSVYVPKVIFTPDDDFHNDSINIISGEIVVVTLPDTDEKLHSPHRASMFSAIIPGVGQIYNKKYWKIPILFGGIGGVAYAISFNSERYSYYRGAYRDFIIRDPANKSYLEIIEGTVITEERIYGDAQQWFRDYLNNSKNRFKRYRDISYAGMVFVYVINIIDASIDAHFYYFDVSDDLSFTIEPAYFHFNGDIGGAFGLSLKLNF
ncbi:MAG: DUF5683 domain-containing protein [Marinilabiliaceae bacterium]|nr:DUF5683 domain-containing protein [Marinilabiliaceae bacterium]